MGNVRVIATGLEFPEGPVVMPDGSVVLVEIRGKRLTRVYPDGRKEVVAEIPGGPNGAALGPDGKMYICNNGGFSWIPTRNMIMPGPQPDDYLGGSIQRVDMQSGKVETVVDACGLTYLHVFPFSPRPGTPAARMPQVTGDAVKERARQLRERGAAALRRHLDSEVGTVRRVLAESHAIARTEQFTQVQLAAPAATGVFLDVAIANHDGRRLRAA